MIEWTWRETVASWIHRLAYKFSEPDIEEILIRDAEGNEIFSIFPSDVGFVATGPVAPHTAHTRVFADEDDVVGMVVDW